MTDMTLAEWQAQRHELQAQRPFAQRFIDATKRTIYTGALIASLGLAAVAGTYTISLYRGFQHVTDEIREVMESEGFQSAVDLSVSSHRVYNHLHRDGLFKKMNHGYLGLKGLANDEFAADWNACMSDWERFEANRRILAYEAQNLQSEVETFLTASQRPDRLLRYTLSRD